MLLAIACARVPVPGPMPKQEATYVVGYVGASGASRVSAVYTLKTRPEGGGTWVIETLRTEGTFDEGVLTWTYDSEAPKNKDPWFLTLQHTIASVPARYRFEAGMPVALLEVGAWRLAAEKAVTALGLPPQAGESAAALQDPEGLVLDLRRTFPGAPGETWTREERIAGVLGTRTDTCAVAREGGLTTWTCEGTIDGKAERAQLSAVTSTTVIVADRHGLVSLDDEYVGTLVVLDPDGQPVTGRPVGAKRRVARRSGERGESGVP